MKSLRILALVGIFSLVFPLALAQEKPADPPKPADVKQEDKKEEPKRDPKSLEYEKAVKELKKVEGSLTFYQRKKEILWEVPEAKLGQLLYVQATLSTGAGQPLQAGDPINNIDVFRLERQEDTLHFVRPNVQYRWDAKDPLGISSERSFPQAYLASFRIEQTDPEKKVVLVNLTNLFNGEVFRLSEMINMGLGGAYMLDSNRSGPDKVLSFPDNAVVRMQLNYNSLRGMSGGNSLADLLAALMGASTLEDKRNLPLKVSYSLWYPAKSDYRPRLSDPRVGYFTTDYFSIDKFLDRDRNVRLIQRWNLKKKDPSAALSEPVKPIVWTLDPSIPPAYRGAVRTGILRWNKAFEKLGFKDAVRVQDPPKDADYDHADSRYNVVRWTMTPDAAYAVAHFRTDPLSGEILNAAVTVDANLPAFSFEEQADIALPAAQANGRFAKALLRQDGHRHTGETVLFGQPEMAEVDDLFSRFGWKRSECRHAEGLAAEASFALNALASGPISITKREAFVEQFIADVVSHEVGHCLGLRHNFVASSYMSSAQMADDALTTASGYSASVMDYNPVNTLAVLKGKGNFYMPTIGPYDLWAIRYGYEAIPGTTPLDEKFSLSRIAGMAGRPGLAYNTDEDADMYDPLVVRFDGGSDPIEFAAKNLELGRRVLRYALTQLPKPGESYVRRTQMILGATGRVFREGRYSARFIGGLVKRRLNAGDSKATLLSPVPASDQRRALKLVVDNCLSESAFALPLEARLNLGFDPESSQGADWQAPMRERTAVQQQLLVGLLLSSDRVDQIAENAYRLEGAKQPAYSLNEHYGAIVKATFAEVAGGRNVPALRRDLQRAVLQALITQGTARTGLLNNDARAIAGIHLRSLVNQVKGRIGKSQGLSEGTKAHLQSMSYELEQALKKP